jgi:hypothetical protein
VIKIDYDFSYNEWRAYLLLSVRKDIKLFEKYCEQENIDKEKIKNIVENEL